MGVSVRRMEIKPCYYNISLSIHQKRQLVRIPTILVGLLLKIGGIGCITNADYVGRFCG